MKKYMIRCDMEGASGIVSPEQAAPSGSEYAVGREYFMSDLLAAIKGLHDGGAEEIHIYDMHYYGRNIALDKLPEYVFPICGKPNYTAKSAGGLDASFDGMILLGLHSKAGTAGALLNHSYESDIKDILLNGQSVGEIGMEAAIADSFGVPLVMVSADSEGVAETKSLMGGVTCVTVKDSLSESGALCYPLEKTRKLIYSAALHAAKSTSKYVPRPSSKTTLEFTFYDTPYASKYYEIYGKAAITGETAVQCWAEYLIRKTEVFKAL